MQHDELLRHDYKQRLSLEIQDKKTYIAYITSRNHIYDLRNNRFTVIHF